MSEGTRKKRKWKYKQHAVEAKRAKQGKEPRSSGKLSPGMRGFFITCPENKERQCLMEAYDLLNEVVGNLSEDWDMKKRTGEQSDADCSDEEDVTASLEKECSSLRHGNERKLNQVRTGVKNCLFVTCCDKVVDPAAVVDRLMRQTKESGNSKSRFIQRILPVQVTCRAFVDSIRKKAEELIHESLKDRSNTEFTYCVQFKSRSNSDVTRSDVLDVIPEVMRNCFPLCRVNLGDPDVTIIVEIAVGICCLSVVSDFFKFRKFNIQQVAAMTEKGS